jgi:hypothetical protein
MISARHKRTQQHNNTTTQQHNNTTTQQHNNTTTEEVVQAASAVATIPHPENNYDGGSTAKEVGEVHNVRCEDRRGARSLSVFCQRLVKNMRDIFFYVIDIPYSTRTIRRTNLIQRCQ